MSHHNALSCQRACYQPAFECARCRDLIPQKAAPQTSSRNLSTTQNVPEAHNAGKPIRHATCGSLTTPRGWRALPEPNLSTRYGYRCRYITFRSYRISMLWNSGWQEFPKRGGEAQARGPSLPSNFAGSKRRLTKSDVAAPTGPSQTTMSREVL